MGWYSTINVEYDYNALRFVCKLEDHVYSAIDLEFRLNGDREFKHHGLVRNLSYEFDSGLYLPHEFQQIIDLIREIFTKLDMNIDKYLEEFKNKMEEVLPNLSENEL